MSRSHTGVRAALLGLVALAHTVPLSAQQPSPLKPGQRVRVTTATPGATPDVGTLVRVARDTIVLERELRTWRYTTGWVVDTVRTAVPVATATGLDVSVGHGNRVGLGFLIGAAGGALIGGPAAVAAARAISGAPYRGDEASGAFALGALAGGLLGGGLGALVGLSIHWERWDPVPLEQVHRLQIGLMHDPGGRLRVGASVPF